MRRPVLAVALVGGLALTAAPASATAATRPLPCTASASPHHPLQWTHVRIKVKSKPGARARFLAHFKTGTNPRFVTVNAQGVGHTQYYVAKATPGYKVVVTVRVDKGDRVGYCRTYFIPRKR